jgi:hypothetical protein
MLNYLSKTRKNCAAFISNNLLYLIENRRLYANARRSKITLGVKTANKKQGRSY